MPYASISASPHAAIAILFSIELTRLAALATKESLQLLQVETWRLEADYNDSTCQSIRQNQTCNCFCFVSCLGCHELKMWISDSMPPAWSNQLIDVAW